MNTFLVEPDFDRSVKVLDYRRLGKQRLEALKIIKAVNDPTNELHEHQAVKMWRGWEDALKAYFNAAVKEWVRRGRLNEHTLYKVPANYNRPIWLGDQLLHSSHRGALLAKDPSHYEKFGWTDKPVVDYYWPLAYQQPDYLPAL